ncbi:MAG: DUF4189 domain-containing protein [Polaromonas sp.]|nr:DUF4189 domain-containing protein [Polaromonas sp.]
MLSRIQAAAARLTLLLILALAGGQAMAAGTLAIDTLQGEKYGFSFNHPSIDQADARAMRECGPDCSVVLRFRAECAAYSADQARGSNAYGWATGTTSSAVQARANSECRAKGGSSCKVRSWGCDAANSSPAQDAPSRDSGNNNNSNNGNSNFGGSSNSGNNNFGNNSRNDNANSNRGNDNNSRSRDVAPEFQMQGDWLVDYAGSAGFPYNGTLRVQAGGRGVMVLEFTNNQGQSKKVRQDVQITVRGNQVVIQGSNPVYLQGSGNYSPDAYTMTIASNNLLRGSNNDSSGAGGGVVISRR